MKQVLEYSTIETYLVDILYLHDVPKRLRPVLEALLHEKSSSGRLVLNASLKREIAQNVKLSVSSINNGLTILVKSKVLIREDKGLFRFNPELFGWENWENIRELRLNLIYDVKGRTFESHVVESKPKSETRETIMEKIKRKRETTR